MASVSYPAEFDANFVGKSREGGSFEDRESGDKVEFLENYDITFESSDGLMQTCSVGAKAWAEASDVPAEKMQRFQPIHVIGDVVVTDVGDRMQRARFKPSSIKTAAAAPVKA